MQKLSVVVWLFKMLENVMSKNFLNYKCCRRTSGL
jgi:hypothetical protein